MEKIKIGDPMWHPCSLDIIKHTVYSIQEFENETLYHLRADKGVGASGRVEVTVRKYLDKYTFAGFVDTDDEDIAYASGLQDLIEGSYYTDENTAKVEFYRIQYVTVKSSEYRQERLYKESVARTKQVKLLIDKFLGEEMIKPYGILSPEGCVMRVCSTEEIAQRWRDEAYRGYYSDCTVKELGEKYIPNINDNIELRK